MRKLTSYTIIMILFILSLLSGCTIDDPAYIQVDPDNPITVTVDTTSSVSLSAPIDSVSGALVIIDSDHHEVHKGETYVVTDTVAANTTTVKWQVTTPATTTYSHLIFELTATGEATFMVTEGSDRADGTALAEVNRRRVGTPNVAATIVTRTPTGGTTDGATMLFSLRNGITGTGSKSLEAGTARAIAEWILKPNTKYVVSITTYAAVYVTVALNWYEEAE